MKRLFTLAFGLGAGMLVGAAFVRRLDEAKQAVTPAALAGQVGKAAASFVERFQQTREHTHDEASRVEDELRAQFDVPSVDEVLRD